MIAIIQPVGIYLKRIFPVALIKANGSRQVELVKGSEESGKSCLGKTGIRSYSSTCGKKQCLCQQSFDIAF